MNATIVNLPQFAKAMDDYLAITSKSSEEAFAHQARQFAFDLYSEFSKLKPQRGEIEDSAAARGWAVRRKGDALTPAGRYGVSKKAVALAESMMDGKPSELFKVSPFGIYPARFSNKGRLLKAGRLGGNKWRSRGKSLTGLDDSAVETLAQTGLPDNVKRLNVVAVARGLEVKFRKRAGEGGFMAHQWLPKVWRKRKGQWELTAGTTVATDRRSRPIGSVTVQRGNGQANVAIAGAIPGTAELSERTGAGDRAINARVADIYSYINRKLSEVLK
jgi:hypothetical protein